LQDMKLQDMKLEDKQRKSSNRDYIRMQCLLLFSKHATVKCTRRNVYSLKKRQCIVVHYNHALLNFTYLRWTHYAAISCPATWSVNFMSCIFMSCYLVRHFHVLQFHVRHFQRPRFLHHGGIGDIMIFLTISSSRFVKIGR